MAITPRDISTPTIDGTPCLDPLGRDAVGDTVYLQRISRRLATPTGGLLGAPDWGYWVAGQLSGAVTETDRSRVIDATEQECLDDPETLAVQARVAEVTTQGNKISYALRLALTKVDKPSPLTLTIDTLTIGDIT